MFEVPSICFASVTCMLDLHFRYCMVHLDPIFRGLSCKQAFIVSASGWATQGFIRGNPPCQRNTCHQQHSEAAEKMPYQPQSHIFLVPKIGITCMMLAIFLSAGDGGYSSWTTVDFPNNFCDPLLSNPN